MASTPEDHALRLNSVGRPILFAEVKIAGFDGGALPVGEPGAILGRSPGGVTAYFNNPERAVETFRDGWINTGDVSYLDEDGFLFISGRLKDVIVTGGQNVHAGEVEEAILNLLGVAQCAVIGLYDDLWGERVGAVVVSEEGQVLDAGAIVAGRRKILAGFKTPKQVLFQSDPLPQTPTGKVRKFVRVECYKDTPVA